MIASILSISLGCKAKDTSSMTPSESKNEFTKFIESSGKTTADISSADAVIFMLEFYRQTRARNCPVSNNGDMLLYQWGTYDWGEGETFNFNITRQFILEGSQGDEGMSQLLFTIHFSPTDNLRQLDSGNKWCESPSGIDDFKTFIINSETYKAINNLKPLRVEIDWDEI